MPNLGAKAHTPSSVTPIQDTVRPRGRASFPAWIVSKVSSAMSEYRRFWHPVRSVSLQPLQNETERTIQARPALSVDDEHPLLPCNHTDYIFCQTPNISLHPTPSKEPDISLISSNHHIPGTLTLPFFRILALIRPPRRCTARSDRDDVLTLRQSDLPIARAASPPSSIRLVRNLRGV